MADIPRLDTDFTPKAQLDLGGSLAGAERINYLRAQSAHAHDELGASRKARELAGQYDLSTDDGRDGYGNALMGVDPRRALEVKKGFSDLQSAAISRESGRTDLRLARLNYAGRLLGSVSALPDDQVVQGFNSAKTAFMQQFPGDHALDGLPEATSPNQVRAIVTQLAQANLSAKERLAQDQDRATSNYLGLPAGVDAKTVASIQSDQQRNALSARGQDLQYSLGLERLGMDRERYQTDPTAILGRDMMEARGLEAQGVDPDYMTPRQRNALNYTGKGGAAQDRYAQSHAYQDPTGAKYSQADLWRQYQKDASDPMNAMNDAFPKTFDAWIQGNGFSPVSGSSMAGVGGVAAMSESGGNPGAINPHDGDGPSYGVFQLHGSAIPGFIASDKSMSKLFSGLAPGTPEFDAKWRQVASRAPEKFAQAQLGYIVDSHVKPLVDSLARDGFDAQAQPEPVQSLLFSTAVQFGPNTGVVSSALDKLPENASPADVIAGVTAEKIAQRPSGTVSRWRAEEQQALGQLWGSGQDVQSMARYPGQAKRFLASIQDPVQRRQVMASLPKDVAGALLGQSQQPGRQAGVTVDPGLAGTGQRGQAEQAEQAPVAPVSAMATIAPALNQDQVGNAMANLGRNLGKLPSVPDAAVDDGARASGDALGQMAGYLWRGLQDVGAQDRARRRSGGL